MTPYAVIGDPIAHSKSPLIHAMFAEQTGESISYEKIHVLGGELSNFIREFFASGGGGLNVTLPHKEAVCELADVVSEAATLSRSANTLWLAENHQLHADTTDGPGLIIDLNRNLNVHLQGKSVLLLGAGGSARGTLTSIIEQQPSNVTVLNRTLSRAQSLRNDFSQLFPIAVESLEFSPTKGFDIIINATSSSIAGELPPLQPEILADSCVCYDLMYSESDTPFMAWAKSNGAEIVADGLGMLVEQAAESFNIWRGVRPDTAEVIAALR